MIILKLFIALYLLGGAVTATVIWLAYDGEQPFPWIAIPLWLPGIISMLLESIRKR